MDAHAALLNRVSCYYGDKVRAHGPTAAGVDWKSAEQQALRFDQLLTLCEGAHRYSLIDYGCGTGALVAHLRRRAAVFNYQGYDICPDMIAHARTVNADAPDCRFCSDAAALQAADYVLASGIFNVRGTTSVAEWTRHLWDTLDRMASLARKGLAFNVFSTHVDYRRDDLYYADPGAVLNHCASRYSRRVAVLHDYELYEFTVIVRT